MAVVVGPNGSGKSNVADAIVWAAGSLAPSELRAEKPDDVLFAGGAERKAAEHCEVELLFDNADGAWPDRLRGALDRAAAPPRRRGAVPRQPRGRAPRSTSSSCSPTSASAARMHSIIGQGRVEEILASTPEKRRELVEEAAGLGRFKRRRHRAELKLARVEIQVERARDVEAEVRKRLRPLALQATAAERAERSRDELAAHEAPRSPRSTSPRCEERLAATDDRAARGAARTPQRRGAARGCARRARGAPRRSSPTRPGGARARRLRSTGCAAARERLALRREQAEGLRVERARRRGRIRTGRRRGHPDRARPARAGAARRPRAVARRARGAAARRAGACRAGLAAGADAARRRAGAGAGGRGGARLAGVGPRRRGSARRARAASEGALRRARDAVVSSSRRASRRRCRWFRWRSCSRRRCPR